MEYLQRREVLLRSGAAAGILLLESHGFAVAAQAGEQPIPWSDQRAALASTGAVGGEEPHALGEPR
jgi:hypothetical protein